MFSSNSAIIIKNGTSEKKSGRSKSGENTGRLVTLLLTRYRIKLGDKPDNCSLHYGSYVTSESIQYQPNKIK